MCIRDSSTPVVMGILNVTPDSFYAGSRKQTEADIEERIQAILSEGGQIIDIGGYSSRPDAEAFSYTHLDVYKRQIIICTIFVV